VSALPPQTAAALRDRRVRFGPEAAVSRCSKNPLSLRGNLLITENARALCHLTQFQKGPPSNSKRTGRDGNGSVSRGSQEQIGNPERFRNGPAVRFGSTAAMTRSNRNVRFTPESSLGSCRPARQSAGNPHVRGFLTLPSKCQSFGFVSGLKSCHGRQEQREAAMPRSFLFLLAFIGALWAVDFCFLNGQFSDLVSSEMRYQANQINGAARNLADEVSNR
jgi:hypothetical protein